MVTRRCMGFSDEGSRIDRETERPARASWSHARLDQDQSPQGAHCLMVARGQAACMVSSSPASVHVRERPLIGAVLMRLDLLDAGPARMHVARSHVPQSRTSKASLKSLTRSREVKSAPYVVRLGGTC